MLSKADVIQIRREIRKRGHNRTLPDQWFIYGEAKFHTNGDVEPAKLGPRRLP